MDQKLFVVCAAVFGFVLLVICWLASGLLSYWLRALLSGAPISIFQLLGTRLRGNPLSVVVHAYIALRQRGVPATVQEVESVLISYPGRAFTALELADLVQELQAANGPPAV